MDSSPSKRKKKISVSLHPVKESEFSAASRVRSKQHAQTAATRPPHAEPVPGTIKPREKGAKVAVTTGGSPPRKGKKGGKGKKAGKLGKATIGKEQLKKKDGSSVKKEEVPYLISTDTSSLTRCVWLPPSIPPSLFSFTGFCSHAVLWWLQWYHDQC